MAAFPKRAKRYQDQLRALGPAGRLVLVERSSLGDDRTYTYLVTFGTRTYRFAAGLASDGRLVSFNLRPQ